MKKNPIKLLLSILVPPHNSRMPEKRKGHFDTAGPRTEKPENPNKITNITEIHGPPQETLNEKKSEICNLKKELDTEISQKFSSNLIIKRIEKLEHSFDEKIGPLISKTSENSDKITNMIETYMSLQKTLDEKDFEICRLKKGYDAEIFRNFLKRFIRIDQMIDESIHLKEGDPKTLHQLKHLFKDSFDECGVESFSPQVGKDYRHAWGVADNPKKVITEDPKQDFTIAEVLEFGYRLRNGSDHEIITPSKVSIYRHEQHEQ